MENVLTLSSIQDGGRRYIHASRCLQAYFPVRDGINIDVTPVEYPSDLLAQTTRGHFSFSNIVRFSWVSHSFQIQRKTLFVRDLGHASLHLRAPLPLFVEVTEDGVAAYSYDLDEIGFGPDESAALEDVQQAVVETYFLLKAEQNQLGALQRRHWDFLRGLIRED